ncbi:MAG: acyltransferase [Bacteroidetes bacterium]|nr:acyltransferase [Bacteroidota bacterium]
MNRYEGLQGDQSLIDLFNKLNSLKEQIDILLKESFDRALPFPDVLFDRWQRATKLGFGRGTSIYDSSYIFGKVHVGENTWIGPFTILDGSGGLRIGNNCSISAGVQIYTHDTVNWAVTGGVAPYDYAETSIGNNCYIAPNCIISKGVHIDNNCIIGANSFVNASFPAYSKLAGNPAKLIS